VWWLCACVTWLIHLGDCNKRLQQRHCNRGGKHEYPRHWQHTLAIAICMCDMTPSSVWLQQETATRHCNKTLLHKNCNRSGKQEYWRHWQHTLAITICMWDMTHSCGWLQPDYLHLWHDSFMWMTATRHCNTRLQQRHCNRDGRQEYQRHWQHTLAITICMCDMTNSCGWLQHDTATRDCNKRLQQRHCNKDGRQQCQKNWYGVASVSRIDIIIGLFCKRAI